MCERVSDDAVVSEDVNMNYASDQSCDSNKSVDSSEGEEHWDTDTEEILKDLEKSDDDGLHSESSLVCSSLNLILLFLSVWGSFYGVSATALNHLIGFLHHVFSTVVTNSIETIAAVFPSSLYMAHKYFGVKVHKFEKYVVCIKCGSLYCYVYQDCFETIRSKQHPRSCYIGAGTP